MRNYYKVTRYGEFPKGFSELQQLRAEYEVSGPLDGGAEKTIRNELAELTPRVVAEAYFFFDHFDTLAAAEEYSKAELLRLEWAPEAVMSVWKSVRVSPGVNEIGTLKPRIGAPRGQRGEEAS